MKRLLKPLLIGSACGVVTFPLSGWAAFSLLLRYHGFDQAQTDPDYHAAIALGSWTCFIQAVVFGTLVGRWTGYNRANDLVFVSPKQTLGSPNPS